MISEALFISTVERLKVAQHVVIFTGAGISAESGIATFRDHLTGLWSQYDPQQLATRQAFLKDPRLVWGWYSWRRMLVGKAQPNDAHLAVVKLKECLPQVTVITQNVDDLHERAGCKDLIHLHGNLASARCFECNRPYLDMLPLSEEPDGLPQEPPRCHDCNGRVRPDVIWFGEALPEEDVKLAFKAAYDCDVMLVVGTSGSVYPAAHIPELAREKGAWLVHINTESKCALSDKTLVGPASLWLPRIVEALA